VTAETSRSSAIAQPMQQPHKLKKVNGLTYLQPTKSRRNPQAAIRLGLALVAPRDQPRLLPGTIPPHDLKIEYLEMPDHGSTREAAWILFEIRKKNILCDRLSRGNGMGARTRTNRPCEEKGPRRGISGMKHHGAALVPQIE